MMASAGACGAHMPARRSRSVASALISEGFDLAAFYRRTTASHDPRAAFIFDGIDDEIIGNFGLQGGGAAGIEIDHADTALGTPTHALILASSEGHTEAFRLVNEEMSITVPTVTAPVEARIQADMVFFETAGGGGVFNVGSIATAWKPEPQRLRQHSL